MLPWHIYKLPFIIIVICFGYLGRFQDLYFFHSFRKQQGVTNAISKTSVKKTGHNSTIYTSSSHKLKDRHSEQCGIHNNSTPGEEPDCIIAGVHVLNYLFSYLIAFFISVQHFTNSI